MKVFLSASHKDREATETFLRVLEDAGLTVWSGRNVMAGVNIGHAVGAALDEADAMVVLISRESAESPSIRHEIQYALGEGRFEGRLVPVLLEATPNIPWILQKIQAVEVTKGVTEAAMRVAAMLREQDRVTQ